MMWGLDKIVVDCGSSTCAPSPWQDPKTFVPKIPQPFWETGFMLFAVVLVIIVVTITVAIVKYNSDGPTRADRRLSLRKAELDTKARIAEAHNTCTNCGVVYAPKLENISG